MDTQEQKIETLSLVIPCLNEEEVIVEVIREARSIFDSMDLKNYEIIIKESSVLI